jgi:hypothetical protein
MLIENNTVDWSKLTDRQAGLWCALLTQRSPWQHFTMTKPFRVEEQIADATRYVRSPDNWPSDFYDLLRDRNVEPLDSVLINATPDQGCVCMKLIDQTGRVVWFDLEYEGAPSTPTVNAVSRITGWKARETDGEEWWWKETPRMTAPKPNNPILVGLKLLDQKWSPRQLLAVSQHSPDVGHYEPAIEPDAWVKRIRGVRLDASKMEKIALCKIGHLEDGDPEELWTLCGDQCDVDLSYKEATRSGA